VSEAAKGQLARRIQADLHELRDRAQFRTLENPCGINLYSNDYLGLAQDPRLKAALLAAVEAAESVGSTGSRLLSGNSPDWEHLEREFANFAGADSSLYFSSGYAANIGLITAVAGRDDLIFSDSLNHASLIDGIRLSGAARIVYPHADVNFLEATLREHKAHPGAKLIVTESVFSMEGDVAPIRRLAELAEIYDAELIVDEAHAIGVYGPQGRGICAALGIERKVFAVVYTCGKALASAGAFVCGSKELRDFLINHARTFIFSTAMPPYFAAQIRAALRLALAAEDKRVHLRTISESMRAELHGSGIDCGASSSQIIPVYLGGNEAALHVADYLQRAGFAVRAIRPPTVPPGTARIRLSLTASISLHDIRRLAAAIKEACKSLQRLSSASVHA
jgi:8-amino-7-oxononanoate synthase